MQNERWQQIEEIFHVAAEYQGREREEYLRGACGNDDEKLTEILALLEVHENPSRSLETPVFEVGLELLDEQDIERRTGETLGHYKLGRLIGRGGMGEVYVAEDINLGRKVAVKLVNKTFASDPERIRRFRKEARAASLVSHPNVAKLYELCEIGGEKLIVMELVNGVNLRHYMAEAIPIGKAVNIAIQVASALAAAHAAGVVHRDIKPENVIIKPDGTVKVLDFGLAKLVEPIGDGSIPISDGEYAKLTVEMSTELGEMIGTPAYMSPEQIRGAEVDTQTDIWSLGVLLYEMLTGQIPFRGSTKIDLIAAVLIAEPASLQIDNNGEADAIKIVLSKALHKEKTGRYQDIGELQTDLETVISDIETSSNGHFKRPVFNKRSAWKYLTRTVLVIGLVIALVPSWRQISNFYLIAPPPKTVPLQMAVTDGIVSYWPADGNANDAVGHNDGELINGATYRPGVSGQAFSFDGIDDLFSAPTNNVPTGNGDRTLAMWIKVDEFVSEEATFGAYGSPPNGKAYVLGTTEKHLFISNWGANVSDISLNPGRWYHIAATSHAISADTSLVSLYLDGEFRNDSILRIDTASNTQFYSGRLPFGETSDNIRRLKGSVDEIMIYDRALSAAEIQAVYLAHKPSAE